MPNNAALNQRPLRAEPHLAHSPLCPQCLTREGAGPVLVNGGQKRGQPSNLCPQGAYDPVRKRCGNRCF